MSDDAGTTIEVTLDGLDGNGDDLATLHVRHGENYWKCTGVLVRPKQHHHLDNERMFRAGGGFSVLIPNSTISKGPLALSEYTDMIRGDISALMGFSPCADKAMYENRATLFPDLIVEQG